jgi:hypothetical protein
LVGIAEKTGYDVKIPIENTYDNFAKFFDLAKQKERPVSMELRKSFEIPDSYFSTGNEIAPHITHTYNEPFFHFNPEIFNMSDNTDMSGYFQSERYFKHCEQKIRDIFTFKPDIRARAAVELAKVDNDIPTVSIHVRRGDYVANSGNHTVTGLDFYGNCINEFFSDTPHQFVIFSDDTEWCKNAFDGGHVVEINDAYTEMCMMSMCNHHIIGNSTFSWWGAWLDPTPAKIVVAPSLWFGPNLRHNNIVDLIPENWFLL